MRLAVGAVALVLALAGCRAAEPATPAHEGDPASTPPLVAESAPVEVPEGVEVIEVPDGPVGLAAVRATYWATLPESGAVLGPRDRRTEVGSFPLRLVGTPDGVWVSVIGDGTLVRLAPRTGGIDVRVRVEPRGSEPEGLAYDDSSLWVVDQAGDRVLELDPATGRLLHEHPTGHEPRLVTTGPSGTFVGDYTGGTVTRVVDGRATTRNAGSCLSPQGLVEAAGTVWVACTVDGQVVGLDARTLKRVVELPGLENADAVVADGAAVYVVGQEGPTVWTIDARTQEVVGQLVLDDAPTTEENVGAALVGTDLVVAHPESGRIYEVPLRLLR